MTEKTLPTAPEDQERIEGPKRIQRRRTKGWRKPIGAVNVSRPTSWGNPYSHLEACHFGDETAAREWAVVRYKALIRDLPMFADLVRRELAGKDLMCWCPIDQPCHADVLLELANPRTRRIEGRTS